MEHYDVIVIGGGVLGCFTARNLCRWNLSVLLLESTEDVCTGITRANSAIVYSGCDNKPNTLKARMTVHANAAFDDLCRDLDVPFSRCGSLMVSFGPRGERSLAKKLEQGKLNGVPGIRLLSGDEARAMEPMLSPDVTAALWVPSTGTVNPWLLGIAAYENALENGCRARMNMKVTAIEKIGQEYLVSAGQEQFFCRAVVNCAGLSSPDIQEMVFPPSVTLHPDGTDYLVMDPRIPAPGRIIFQESEQGKGITAIPCVEGNLLLESPARPLGIPYATTLEGMEHLKTAAASLLPGLEIGSVIRSFGAVRPNPRHEDGRSIHDFSIEQPDEDFISFIGIKTPGLTCANELGMYAAETIAKALSAPVNPGFTPRRSAIKSTDHRIICQCRNITQSEILEAIRRGASTVDAVKRRAGSGMGPCQGSRCARKIEQLLEEYRSGTL